MTESIRKINYDIAHLRRENQKNLIRIAILDECEHLNLKDSLAFINDVKLFDKLKFPFTQEEKILAVEVLIEMRRDFKETINERAV